MNPVQDAVQDVMRGCGAPAVGQVLFMRSRAVWQHGQLGGGSLHSKFSARLLRYLGAFLGGEVGRLGQGLLSLAAMDVASIIQPAFSTMAV